MARILHLGFIAALHRIKSIGDRACSLEGFTPTETRFNPLIGDRDSFQSVDFGSSLWIQRFSNGESANKLAAETIAAIAIFPKTSP